MISDWTNLFPQTKQKNLTPSPVSSKREVKTGFKQPPDTRRGERGDGQGIQGPAGGGLLAWAVDGHKICHATLDFA